MGSQVQFRCKVCAYTTDKLAVGWGKAGRGTYWGGLAHCATCKAILVVNLAEAQPGKRDHKCPTCKGLLKLVDGTADAVPCPACGLTLEQRMLGTWS